MHRNIEMNAFQINGKSTKDFPFFVAVEENSPPQRANKKDKIIDLPYVNGVLKQSVAAYQSISKEYKFYLYDVTAQQYRQFKTFFADEGWFTDAFEPDLRYNFIKCEWKASPVDLTGGYTITATFTCQPFGMEAEQVITLGHTLVNPTNAPMFPKLVVFGKSEQATFIQIGGQRMFIDRMVEPLTIECRVGYQEVYMSGGRKMNHVVKGEFFEIPPGTHQVTIGTGITSVQMTTRWGWR